MHKGFTEFANITASEVILCPLEAFLYTANLLAVNKGFCKIGFGEQRPTLCSGAKGGERKNKEKVSLRPAFRAQLSAPVCTSSLKTNF